VAEKLGYSGLAQQTEGFLRRLGQRRELIHSQEALHKKVLQMAIFHPKKLSDVLVHEQFIAGSQHIPWDGCRRACPLPAGPDHEEQIIRHTFCSATSLPQEFSP
jgi:hypothetical protein